LRKEFRYAFLQSVPVLFGYLFLAIAFGLMLNDAGYGVLWALLSSLLVYAGSLQFIMVKLFAQGAGFLTALVITLLVNSRHLFYGLSFIEPFKKMRKKYPYMVFSLTDETYSLLCAQAPPSELNREHVFFLIAVLNHLCWIVGSLIGSLAGRFITFDTRGIDFSMTALFVVIFTEQWLRAKSRLPAVIGVICGAVALLIFGPDNFILPALISAVTLLLVFKQRIRVEEDVSEEEVHLGEGTP
jgi:4-azaleucine resistance transporter AzlC